MQQRISKQSIFLFVSVCVNFSVVGDWLGNRPTISCSISNRDSKMSFTPKYSYSVSGRPAQHLQFRQSSQAVHQQKPPTTSNRGSLPGGSKQSYRPVVNPYSSKPKAQTRNTTGLSTNVCKYTDLRCFDFGLSFV